jgi:hypothetical protein
MSFMADTGLRSARISKDRIDANMNGRWHYPGRLTYSIQVTSCSVTIHASSSAQTHPPCGIAALGNVEKFRGFVCGISQSARKQVGSIHVLSGADCHIGFAAGYLSGACMAAML